MSADEIAGVFRKAAWLSSMGHHASAVNLYTKMITRAEEWADDDLYTEAVACCAGSCWQLCKSLGDSEAHKYVPMIEEAVAKGTASAAEARALLTGAWICSDGGRLPDPVAIAFLQRAQEIIATHPQTDVRSEWTAASYLAREMARTTEQVAHEVDPCA